MGASRYYQDEANGASSLSVIVVGVGGAGNNSVNRLSRMGVYGAQTLAVNTDRGHLSDIEAEKKLLIGAKLNKGLGAGGKPEIGERCAENSAGFFAEYFDDADLVFITAGLGGGTGTGAAPLIAEMAARKKALVISIVTMPFGVEGVTKRKIAMQGLRHIEHFSNSTIVLENDTLLEVAPRLSLNQAFGLMDALISELAKSLTEVVTYPSLINLDFNDLRSVLGRGGVSTLLHGEANVDDHMKVVKDATENPFLNVDYNGAKNALIHITGGKGLSLGKTTDIVEGMTSRFDRNATVIFGAREDPHCRNKVKLMAVVTGLKKKRSSHSRRRRDIESIR